MDKSQSSESGRKEGKKGLRQWEPSRKGRGNGRWCFFQRMRRRKKPSTSSKNTKKRDKGGKKEKGSSHRLVSPSNGNKRGESNAGARLTKRKTREETAERGGILE